MPGNAKKRFPFDILERKTLHLGLSIAATVLITLGLPRCLNAGSSVVITDVNAESSSSASLTINTASIDFKNASPSAMQLVPANENPVPVTANVQLADQGTVTLTALAGGDLVSGSHTIPIDKVTWTATDGGGFIAGTMNKITPVPAGSWTKSGTYSGAFSFFLANSWSYATGTYSQTITYTLTVP